MERPLADEPEDIVLRLLREIRAEQGQQRTLLLQTLDDMRKMEQRLDARMNMLDARNAALDSRLLAVRDELVIKAELMGRLAHFETRIEQRFVERDT